MKKKDEIDKGIQLYIHTLKKQDPGTLNIIYHTHTQPPGSATPNRFKQGEFFMFLSKKKLKANQLYLVKHNCRTTM
jgi:hypothetical protein